jgi:hypothetical protein
MGAKLAVLLLAPLGLLAQTPPLSTCNNTPVYSPCELAFELPASAAQAAPYASVELKVEFRSPRKRTLALPGFWDGGRVVVRFSPNEAGEWDYRVTSSVAAWNGQEASFTAAASDAPGFIHPAEVHHWAYTERFLAHLWMGFEQLDFATMDEALFRATVDARAAQKFNHMRGLVFDAQAYSGDVPNLAYFKRLDERVRYLNQKGMVADLILAARPSTLTKAFPGWEQRRRFVRYIAGRYAAMNVTWQGVQEFEGELDARTLLKEIGGVLKEADPYQHPRSSGARVTSAPFLEDGWMDYATHGADADDSVGAVEHQIHAAPFVNVDLGREDSGAGKKGPHDLDAAQFRHRLWNAAMSGEYPTYANTGSGAQYLDSPGAKAMKVWFDLFSTTRHWEMEPHFDVDGARALALEDADYIVYVEKPGPIEVIVEKRTYDGSWIDPATGQVTKVKFKGDHFTGEPPDKSHDWVLRLVREGRLESMAKSYKFESRSAEEGSRALPIGIQDIETTAEKIPFEVEQLPMELSASKPAPYSVKIKRQTRATGNMTWLWTAEATAEGQGYRVVATGAKGEMRLPEGLARTAPATLLVRLYGMNANGKVYEINKACQLTK